MEQVSIAGLVEGTNGLEVHLVPLEPPRLPYAQSRKEAVGGNRTMYRDGEAVYVKGNPKQESKWEKKEEWDGGSTGRVKTKGKRGPGWR